MKNRRTIIIIAVVAALLVLGCCCATSAFLMLGRDKAAYDLSQDQLAVADDFGLPNDFTVVFGEAADEEFDETGSQPTHRVEYWNYRDTRVAVIFRDGRFVRQETLDPLPEGEWAYPAIEPGQIYQGMTAKDLADFIGGSPDEGVQTDSSTGLDLTTVSFGNQVLATFDGEALVALRTLPVPAPAKE